MARVRLELMPCHGNTPLSILNDARHRHTMEVHESMAETVLIVDDDPITHRVLRHYLESAGYKLIAAKSGREALAVATSKLPQLIIMDVLMPEMNGLDALRKLKGTD